MSRLCSKGLHALTSSGVKRGGYLCLDCCRGVQREAQRRQRLKVADLLNAVKLERGCNACGYRSHVAALQFDHIVPRHMHGGAKKDWHGVKNMKQARELACDPNIQVLCANCHCIKTRLNGDYRKEA